MRADGLVILAGGVTFASNFKESGGFPPNGFGILGATFVLTFLAAVTRKSAIEPAVKALAALMLLGAIFRSVPALSKGKNNG